MTGNSKEAKDAPHVDVALVCDGVRKEITGQDTIIGVYQSVFNPESFPVHFRPVLYVRLRFPHAGAYGVEFRVTQGEIPLIQPFTASLQAQDEMLFATVVLGPMPLTIQSPGLVAFGIKIEGQGWSDISTMEFKKLQSL